MNLKELKICSKFSVLFMKVKLSYVSREDFEFFSFRLQACSANTEKSPMIIHNGTAEGERTASNHFETVITNIDSGNFHSSVYYCKVAEPSPSGTYDLLFKVEMC